AADVGNNVSSFDDYLTYITSIQGPSLERELEIAQYCPPLLQVLGSKMNGFDSLSFSECFSIGGSVLTSAISLCPQISTLVLDNCIHLSDKDLTVVFPLVGASLKKISLVRCHNITDNVRLINLQVSVKY